MSPFLHHPCTYLSVRTPYIHLIHVEPLINIYPSFIRDKNAPNPPISKSTHQPMRRRDHEIHPSTHSYVQRRRVPEDTNEIEDTVKKLFHSLNMITHIQTNTLHPYNHISHIRLHVCTIPHHSRAKVMRRKALGRHK